MTINNVAPTVAFTAGPDEVDESGTATRTYTFSITDPGADDVDYDRGQLRRQRRARQLLVRQRLGHHFDCIFADGDALDDVTAQATDSDLDAGNTAEFEMTINNVAPTVAFDRRPVMEVDESGTATRTYTFSITDPGADDVELDRGQLRRQRRARQLLVRQRLGHLRLHLRRRRCAQDA